MNLDCRFVVGLRTLFVIILLHSRIGRLLRADVQRFYKSCTLISVTIASAMADLLDHAAERSASKAVTAIKWNILHDAKHPIDGSPQSFIEFFMRICTLCKLDPVLSAFLESEGMVIASGVTMYASSTRDALIDEALHNQRTPTKRVAGRIVFLPSLVSEHRNAIPAAAKLPAHRTPVAPTGSSSPMSSAPSYTTTDLNADASGRDFDEADMAPLAGDASASRPSAAPVLPTSSPYRIAAWILQRVQQDLGLALHALILNQSLGDKLYEAANGNGIAMLVLIEAHIRNNMHSSQAILTCNNFAHLQLLGKTFPIASPNSAHTFKEWLRDFKEIASRVPHATESADLHHTLTEFVALFPDKHRSDITQQMKIYKSNHKSRTGDCDLSSDDEEASCSAKQLLDYLCHDIHSALRVKDKAAREVTTAEALRLSSASLEKKATPSEIDKLIKQIASLKAQLQAPPAPAPAGTPVRALAAAPEQPAPPRHAAKPWPKNALANYRDFVLTPAMRNCSNCNERHLDRDCPNRPPPEPLRALATAAGAGTADPPKVRAPRPAAIPTTEAAQPPPVPMPANDKPAPALTT